MWVCCWLRDLFSGWEAGFGFAGKWMIMAEAVEDGHNAFFPLKTTCLMNCSLDAGIILRPSLISTTRLDKP